MFFYVKHGSVDSNLSEAFSKLVKKRKDNFIYSRQDGKHIYQNEKQRSDKFYIDEIENNANANRSGTIFYITFSKSSNIIAKLKFQHVQE